MQYTLRNIPPYLDELIRKKAKEEKKSLNEVALEALKRAFGLARESIRYRDLSDVAGSWKADPDFEDAIAEQREIDPDLWR